MTQKPPSTIPAEDWAKTPATVHALVLDLIEMVRALSVEVQELRVRVNQTSKNSSKPPSSDPPSAPPAPPRPPSGRKRGAQPGHANQQRPLLPPDQVHEVVSLPPTTCPTCAIALPADLPEVAPRIRTQVVDLPPITAHVTEYQQHTVCCPQCHQQMTASRPAQAPPGALKGRWVSSASRAANAAARVRGGIVRLVALLP